jgi:hypothetical protein
LEETAIPVIRFGLCRGTNIGNRPFFGPHHCYIRLKVSASVTMKNAVFWDVTPHGCCENRHFGGTYHLHHQGD